MLFADVHRFFPGGAKKAIREKNDITFSQRARNEIFPQRFASRGLELPLLLI